MSVGSEGVSLRCIQRNLFCVTLGKVHSFPRRHFEETIINCWRKSSLSKKKKSQCRLWAPTGRDWLLSSLPSPVALLWTSWVLGQWEGIWGRGDSCSEPSPLQSKLWPSSSGAGNEC